MFATLATSGLFLRRAGPSSKQRALNQIFELIIQLLGMRLQILNHRTHGLPGGNRRDTGVGRLGKYSGYVASTETSP